MEADPGALAQGVRRRPRGEHRLTVRSLDAKGVGEGVVDGYTISLAGTLPGDEVRAEVRPARRGRIRARVLEVLQPSPAARAPLCRHASVCGGCTFQHWDHEAQQDWRRAQVEAALTASGLSADVLPVLGCDPPFGHRNKMDFTFGSRRWVGTDEPMGADRTFALGLHVRGRFEKVLDVEECPVAFPEAAPIVGTVRRLARERGLEPWDVNTHVGLLRHLVVRKSFASGEVMVNIVTAEAADLEVQELADALCASHPEITTVVQNVTTRMASVAVGEWERTLHGSGTITERIGDTSFVISANSFFQTNSRQAAVLFETVRVLADPRPDDVVWDLYCGTGTLGLTLASAVRAVHGFEIVADAVENARRNATLNGRSNAHFVVADVLALLSGRLDEAPPPPSLCLVDPPRAGLHPAAVKGIIGLRPPRIVFVSCNVRTTAPQIAAFVSAGYRVDRVQPIDMFPHTPHLECVFRLVRDDPT